MTRLYIENTTQRVPDSGQDICFYKVPTGPVLEFGPYRCDTRLQSTEQYRNQIIHGFLSP